MLVHAEAPRSCAPTRGRATSLTPARRLGGLLLSQISSPAFDSALAVVAAVFLFHQARIVVLVLVLLALHLEIIVKSICYRWLSKQLWARCHPTLNWPRARTSSSRHYGSKHREGPGEPTAARNRNNNRNRNRRWAIHYPTGWRVNIIIIVVGLILSFSLV